MEGDATFSPRGLTSGDFNPRPPWGGRRSERGRFHLPYRFQSTPSVGRATTFALNNSINAEFQSTPSVGRATRKSLKRYSALTISIHALRGEGDPFGVVGGVLLSDFNPRPPWGGRHCGEDSAIARCQISIHALRGEGDNACASSVHCPVRFQSTPSVGRATSITKKISDTLGLFQSTPSVGRATFPLRPSKPLTTISIHALRGEGDKGNRQTRKFT